MSGKRTKEKRKLSVAQTEPWTPLRRAHPPRGLENFPGVDYFLNSRYQVNVTKFVIDPPFGRCIHLSVKTLDKKAHHDWRDFQRIKNEIVGPEYEAVELYPAESRMVDTSNQYHMWCFLDFKFPFGYKSRQVCEDTGNTGARQRPFELKPEGLEVPNLEECFLSTYEEMYYGKKID